MPSYIVKPEADEDFYVELSTITDTISSFGDHTRYAIDRIKRADEKGTSALWGCGDDFDDRNPDGLWFRTEWYPEIPEAAVCARIPWSNVRAFCDTFRDGEFHPTPDLITQLQGYDEETDEYVAVDWEATR